MTNRIKHAWMVLAHGAILGRGGWRVEVGEAVSQRALDNQIERTDLWHGIAVKKSKEVEQLRDREAKRRAKDANTIRSLTAQLKAQAAAHKRWRDEHPGLQAAVDGVVEPLKQQLDGARAQVQAAHGERDELQRRLDASEERADRLVRERNVADAAREVAEHNLLQARDELAKVSDALTEDRNRALRERNEARSEGAGLRRSLADVQAQLAAAMAEIQRRDDEAARRDDVVEVKP